MSLENLKKMNVLLVADLVDDHEGAKLDSMDLELVEDTYFRDLSDTLSQICNSVTHYPNPQMLMRNLHYHQHQDCVVFSVWSGQASRNRRALVPSICEAYGMRYVGADTYTNIICQDKAVSKKLIVDLGFSTPAWVLITSDADLRGIEALSTPLVVKPNYEGGSIGISSENLVHSHEKAVTLSKKLMALFEEPILVEEFVPGREVCMCLFGDKNSTRFIEATEIFIKDDPQRLITDLWGYELKKQTGVRKGYRLVTQELSRETISRAERLFTVLEKVEVLRIDGRLNDEGVFSVIELTPDIHMGRNASFAKAFDYKGIDYQKMLEMILLNTLGLY